MKTCGFENLVDQYLDGELSGAKLRSFEAHLETCPLCREQVEQYRAMLDELHGLDDREVPPLLQDRLHAALVNETEKGDGRVKRKLNPWALTVVAAALVVFVAVGAILANGGVTLHSPNQAPLNNQVAEGTMDSAKGLAGFGAPPSDGFTAQSAPDVAPAATAAATQAAAAPTTSEEKSMADKGVERNAASADQNLLKTDNLAQQPAETRKIIYTANMVVETREFDKSVGTVKAVINKYGGYVENSQANGVSETTAATVGRTTVIALRMPIEKYDTAMGELQAIGNVLSKNESTEDVSRQYVDTEARNKTLTMQRDKLYDLLAKADTMENIIALQNEISRLTVEIEQMTAQLNFWNDKVSYSTITVELHELVTPKSVKPADPDLGSRISGAFYDTINSMKKGLESFAVVFIGFLPWLAIILVVAGVLAAVLVPVARKARKAAALKNVTDEKKKEE
jgi:hypothetical protein